MSEPTTALAQAQPAPPRKLLVAALAEQAGIEPAKFYEAVKVAAGCRGASDAHFMVLLVQAEKYGLDPLRKMIQLLDVGNGPEAYARVDAYKEFILRAERDGVLEWIEYEEGWFLDPRFPAEQKKTRRGGRCTGKLARQQKPKVKTVWFDEWEGGEKSQWRKRPSHMLEHRAHKEWCRDNLGYYVADTDDADRIRGDEPRAVAAEVTDATPAVPIQGLRRRAETFESPFAGAPEVPQGKPEATAGSPFAIQAEGGVPQSQQPASSGADAGPPASPADAPGFDEADSRRLDAEMLAEQERATQGGLFDERP